MGRFVVALLALVLAGCGGSGSSGRGDGGPIFSSALEIRTALNNAGLPCSDYKTVAKDHYSLAEQGNADDVGYCHVEGETVNFMTFKDEGQVDNWLNVSKTVGCTMGGGMGQPLTNVHFVRGGNWGVERGSQTLSEKIAEAIGGEAVNVDCKDVKLPGS